MPDDPKDDKPPGAETAESDVRGGIERRRYPRAPLSLLIQFRFDTLEEFLTEYAVNISIGGMFLRTNEPIEEGSVVYLQFALRDSTKLIEGLGRVVHVNPPGAPDQVAGMGIEFLSLDHESRELIDEIVARNMSKELER